jgi:hypothetical protein
MNVYIPVKLTTTDKCILTERLCPQTEFYVEVVHSRAGSVDRHHVLDQRSVPGLILTAVLHR